MFHTYILKSQKDGGYYFGHTSNLTERLKKHNNGQVKSTKRRRPLIIHYSEIFETKSEAFQREQFFKSFDGRKWLINNSII
jgi:putative endonuclease